jgi:hypothetical protein
VGQRLKKKADPTLRQAFAEELQTVINPLLEELPVALLPMEETFRQCLLQAGVGIFGKLLQQRVDQMDANHPPRTQCRRHGRRLLRVATLFGEVSLLRDYYHGDDGGHCPADALLGLEGSATPALARLVCRAAAQQPYGAASRDLAEYGGILFDERQIQRVVQNIGPDCEPWLARQPATAKAVPILYVTCDGTGTPMRNQELKGRKGRQADGSAKTREVKLGAVFTQHKVDEKGRPIRDHDATTYVGGFQSAEDFGLLLRDEARRRAVGSAQQVVFLSDGAAWTEGIARQCFVDAVSILDFYHAAQRVHQLAALFPDPARQASRWIKLLLTDQVARVITQARTLTDARPELSDPDDNLGFLERHQQRMAYGTYRKKGWFIGSGVIEAGCKNVVGKRLKQSGMFWSETGATCVLNFRTLLLSQRFDTFWLQRHQLHTPKNNALSLAA